MRHTVIFALMIIVVGMSAHALEVTDTVRLNFRVARTEVDTTFADNADALRGVGQHRGVVKHVKVEGGASPEGSVEFNRFLSERRAKAIFNALDSRMSLPADSSEVEFIYLGRDWGGLRSSVEADPNVPARQQVLELIDSAIAQTEPHPMMKLHRLDRGRAYAYLLKNHFPALRQSQLVVDYSIPSSPVVPPAPFAITAPGPVLPPDGYLPPRSLTSLSRNFYMALKTNMLYDAAMLPNIGAEFYLGKNWSIGANWIYGWWDTDRTHWYWRAYGGDITVRRWFGAKADEKPLTGHHLGVYGGIITYDFEFGGTGIMGGKPRGTLWDKCNVVAGVEYGYSLPVARRLNIDFTIGVGYMGGEYYKYVPRGDIYVWQSTHRLRWFGPTKAEISLVWLIGHGNYNAGKGGKK